MDTLTFDRFDPAYYKRRTQEHWGGSPCGSTTASAPTYDRKFFEEVEAYRYGTHPWILEAIRKLDVAGKQVLEVGCGMGSDHMALARAGGVMHAVDLTRRSLEVTARRFELYGYETRLFHADCERMPFREGSFDRVYSFGVVHHTPDTERAVSEIHRVLRPGGKAWITVYHKSSAFFWLSVFLRQWILGGNFRRETLKQQLSRIEAPGDNPDLVIRLFRRHEFARLFHQFSRVDVRVDHLIAENIPKGRLVPRPVLDWASKYVGWYVVVEAVK